ncbi:MAG: hypothetical protein WC786_05955, partial [Patescibacteria group bacterium]
SQEPTDHNEEQRELQRQYEERMTRVRKNIEQLYDQALAEGKNPVDALLDEDFSEGRQIFGAEVVDDFVTTARELEGLAREAFIAQTTERIGNIVHLVYFDPEVRARSAALQAERASQQKEQISFGHLNASIRDFEWSDLSLGGNTTLRSGEKIIEISWPGTEGPTPPAGIREVEDAFRQMAGYVVEHPEIKAVIAVSWMMSRGIAKRLGFQVHPEVSIQPDQQKSVVDWATKARQDKPYVKGVEPKDVQLGVIAREEFLQRYNV